MLDIFSQIFQGIYSTMSDIKFLGISLWDYSIGLSVMALGIAVFLRLFVGDHK